MTPGDTFYFNHPSAHRHLWVVAGGPFDTLGYVIFNFTSERDECDRTCLLGPGDHPFFTHATYVSYLRGRLLPVEVESQESQYFAHQDAVQPSVLRRIQDGALASPFTKKRFRDLIASAI